VASNLETIQRNFLWDSFVKFHLVRWNIAKQPMIQGGLGVETSDSLMKLFLVSDFGDL